MNNKNVKLRRKVKIDQMYTLLDEFKNPVKNTYDKFDLDFLQKEGDRVMNGGFDVTHVPDKLYGVPTGLEEIKLIDYLVYRPIPPELLTWRDVPDISPDSLDMENWYRDLIDYCKEGVWVDGEYWNPYMVYWLNVFVFPVYSLDEDGDIIADFDPGHPFYCNIDRYILDVAWKADMTTQDVSLMGGRGIGKAIDLDELVATLEGYKRMGDITITDKVFGKNGKAIDILAIYDHEDKEMYNVELADGRSVIVCDEHLWGVYDHKQKVTLDDRYKPTKRYPKGKLKRSRGVYKTLTTKEIIDEGLTYSDREDNRWFIPMQEAAEFKGESYHIDPYVLGALIGDGCFSNKYTPSFTSADQEIVDTMTERLKLVGCNLNTRSGKYEYGVVGNGYNNSIATELTRLGLNGTKSYDKFIPNEYLIGSISQRMDLLKGLMDTDGYCSKGGTPQYCTVSDKLKDDFIQLCSSLGIRTSAVHKKTNSNFGAAWTITLRTNTVVFNLSRKISRQKPIPGNKWASNTHSRVPIVNIEYVGKRDARCITVDSEDHLFQVTNNHIVTHNSYLWGSILDREYRLFPNKWNVVSSTNDETTSEAWNKIDECLTAIEKKHPALKHKRITDSLGMKYSGEVIELPDGTTEDRGYLSKFEKITYGKNAGKTRGKRPTKQLIEEFAAFPPSQQKGDLKSCMRESRGSWYVGGAVKKCTVLYSGTGGTVENDQAEGIFLDPIASECIPTYDWEEAGESGCGVFIPTHIKRSGTWEATGCPDIKLGEYETDQEREAKKTDPVAYMGLLQEFPKTIREVFLRRGVNIFNQDRIAHQRVKLDFEKDRPQPGRGFLNWKKAENGKIVGIEWDSAPNSGDIEILEHPHWLQDIPDLPQDEKQPMTNLYVAGCDSIDQGTDDSAYATDNKKGSELAIIIKKRIVDGGYLKYSSQRYVAKYNKRSPDVRSDWDNALKLAYYYNSKVNIEYTKIGIVSWFRDMGFYHLLCKRPSIALQGGDPNKLTNLIGTQASTPVIDHMDQKIAQYIEDYCHDIWFKDVLQQLQDYDRDNRTKFDYVIAMGLAELADEDLLGKVAKAPVRETQEFKAFGFYTDKDGFKQYGVIPDQKSNQNEVERGLQKERDEFMKQGGVRWIDATDPSNIVKHYSRE